MRIIAHHEGNQNYIHPVGLSNDRIDNVVFQTRISSDVFSEAWLLMHLRLKKNPKIVAFGGYLKLLGASKVTLKHSRKPGGAKELDGWAQELNNRYEAESAMV